jgi:hypothetical protein
MAKDKENAGGGLELDRARACLGGLRLRLHERLRPEPCQTVEIAPAPGAEPELEPLAAFKGEVEPRFGGFTWLQLEIHQRSYFAKCFLKMTQLHQRSHSTRGARAGALPNKPLMFCGSARVKVLRSVRFLGAPSLELWIKIAFGRAPVEVGVRVV